MFGNRIDWKCDSQSARVAMQLGSSHTTAHGKMQLKSLSLIDGLCLCLTFNLFYQPNFRDHKTPIPLTCTPLCFSDFCTDPVWQLVPRGRLTPQNLSPLFTPGFLPIMARPEEAWPQIKGKKGNWCGLNLYTGVK